MKQFLKLSLLPVAMLVVSGCSIFEDDEAPLFGQLPEMEQPFEPREAWSDSLSGGGVGEFYSRLTPAITDDMIIAANRIGTVAAFDKVSGDELWEANLRDLDKNDFLDSVNPFDWIDETSALLSGGVLFAYDKVYVGSEHGVLFCLEAKTGKIQWTKSIKGEIITSPAAGDGLVVVNTSSGLVMALHPDTGEERWTFEQEVPRLSLRGTGEPTVAAGAVMVGGANGRLTLLTSDNGLEVWDVAVGSPTGATDLARLVDVDTKPILIGPYLYTVGYQGNLVAIEVRSGRVLWKREYSSYRNIAIEGSDIYVTNAEGHIFSIDRRNGIERWSQPLLFNRGLTEPLVIGSYVVVGDKFGYIHFLDRESGELVAYYEVDSDGLYSQLVKDGEQFVVQSRGGRLSVFSLPEAN